MDTDEPGFDADDLLATALWRDAAADDGAAARAHLAEGRPVYFSEPDTPAGLLIKEYPGGRRELVRFDHGIERRVPLAA